MPLLTRQYDGAGAHCKRSDASTRPIGGLDPKSGPTGGGGLVPDAQAVFDAPGYIGGNWFG